MVGIPDKWFAIVNPVSGRGRGLDDWPLLSKQLREWHIIPDYAFTEYRYHATELLVQALADGYRKVIIVGGDGTVHEAINGLFIQKEVMVDQVTVGIIAIGSETSQIHIAGVPRKYSEAVRAIANGKTRPYSVSGITYHDSHYCQQRHMAIEAHVGFETHVKKRYNRLNENGKHQYWWRMRSLFRSLIRYRHTGMKVWIDGVLEVNDLVYGAAVSVMERGRQNGYMAVERRGKASKPKFRWEDAHSGREENESESGKTYLKLAIIKRVNFFNVLFHLKALYRGNLYKLNEVKYYFGRHIKIESSPEVELDVDGEILGYSPLEFLLDDNKINLVVGDQ